MLTRKDFEALVVAMHISQYTANLSEEQYKCVVGNVAYQMETVNPRFNRDRFIKACMTPGNSIYKAVNQNLMANELKE